MLINLNFTWEAIFNQLFQTGGKSLSRRVAYKVMNLLSVLNALTGMSILALLPNFVNCHFTILWFYVVLHKKLLMASSWKTGNG